VTVIVPKLLIVVSEVLDQIRIVLVHVTVGTNGTNGVNGVILVMINIIRQIVIVKPDGVVVITA
jgi:hypothetical protein